MAITHIKLDKTKKDWWKSAVLYQIYPKTFQDSNHDGIGDLQGIISRLDYLDQLGIDGIWMSPMLQSPQVDNGYDISDYQAVDPMFGTMADMEELISEAQKRGISIILDLVLNHTSDQHRWFREAKKDKSNPYHDYYVWRDGQPGKLPNDMRAAFGGPAWTYVPELGQYYFHQFAVQQPDLNWDNPAVRRELYDMIRFWVDKGIQGFRLDVIDQIAKDPDRKITGNGPRLHDFLRELSAEGFREDYLVTVGEAWGADVERARLYSAPDGSELSMVFQFQHICLDQQPGKDKWDLAPLFLPSLKKCMAHWQTGLEGQGWNSLFLNNHDLPRIVSRWGNDREYRVESAKMLGAIFHGMQGTPFVYQGEELGMTNIKLQIDEYEDLESVNLYKERLDQGYDPADIMESIYARSRDNARTMMQWSDVKHAGFSDVEPWFVVNPNYTEINAKQALTDENSVFYFYQKLIALRKELEVIRDGSFTLLCEDDEQIFAYRRDLGADAEEEDSGETAAEAKSGETAAEAKPGENVEAVKSGETAAEAKSGADAKEAKPGENVEAVKSGGNVEVVKPGENVEVVKPGETAAEANTAEGNVVREEMPYEKNPGIKSVHLLVLANFSGREAEIPQEVVLDKTMREGRIILINYPEPSQCLRPYEVRYYLRQ